MGGLLSWTFELHYCALAFLKKKKKISAFSRLLDTVPAFLAEENRQNNIPAHTQHRERQALSRGPYIPI